MTFGTCTQVDMHDLLNYHFGFFFQFVRERSEGVHTAVLFHSESELDRWPCLEPKADTEPSRILQLQRADISRIGQHLHLMGTVFLLLLLDDEGQAEDQRKGSDKYSLRRGTTEWEAMTVVRIL